MKLYIATIILFTQLISGATLALNSSAVENYFYEIALGAEYGSNDVTIKKWTSDINIYCDGEWNNELLRELDTIINDLTPLMGSVKINVVKQNGQQISLLISVLPQYIQLRLNQKLHHT